MTSAAKRIGSVKGPLAIAIGMLLLMVFLLVMSNRTGQRTFELAKQQLDSVEAVNVRMDGALFMSLFELQIDFDLLARLQAEMRTAGEELASVLPESGQTVLPLIERKLEAVEAFKSNQAIFRNSRAIAGQLIAELWQRPEVRVGESDRILFDVERAMLDFVGRRDAESSQRLVAALERAASARVPLTELEEWHALVEHAETLIDYTNRLGAVLASEVFYQFPVVLYEEGRRLAQGLASSVAKAGLYRSLLFVVGVLLLAFSAAMVIRVRRYLHMMERYNDVLEDRVRERTEQLASVNEALRSEIAEREHVEAQLRIAQKLEAIGQLASGIAHEINTPTQYVSDNVSFLSSVWRDLEPVLDDYERIAREEGEKGKRSRELLERANVSFVREEVPRALEQAAAGLRQIGAIVAAMRNFSHPGGIGLQEGNLNAAIESTVIVARNQWKHVAELTVDLDPNLPLVPCNLSAVNQALLNLVVNAVHAIESSKREGELGRIRISSRSFDDHVEIAVEDDGPGVPAEIQDRIFDPFFTTKEIGKGTGQGLAISHRIVHKMHGGTLTYEPVRGRPGARFVIRLPLARRESSIEPQASYLEAAAG